MTDPERAAFPNLILLCNAHHKLVDRLERERYTVEILAGWKKDNEPEDGLSTLDPRFNAFGLESLIEEFAKREGLTREVKVAVMGGIVTHADGVTSLPLDALGVVICLNPELEDRKRVIVVDINNSGTLPVTIDSIDFSFQLKPNAGFIDQPAALLGRNDFDDVNPRLPYRLRDGYSLQWFMELETPMLSVHSAQFQLGAIQAVVRLGSGERVTSSWELWPDDLWSAGALEK